MEEISISIFYSMKEIYGSILIWRVNPRRFMDIDLDLFSPQPFVIGNQVLQGFII